MRLTHLGHACLLVEVDDTRILIDPGTFADDFTSLTGLHAILMTHQHPDHADPERLPVLVKGNPDALVAAERQAADVVAEQTGGAVEPQHLAPGASVQVGSAEVRTVGEQHAVIHEAIPRIGNTGLVVRGSSGPTLFHPGDAYDAEPGRVDILAVPVNAPWAKVSATAAFVQRIAPRYVVPIHDGLLNETGRGLYLRLIDAFAPEGTELRDLADRAPVDIESAE